MSATHLGQLLLTGVPGPELDPPTAATFRKLQPGGYILFGRNIQSPEQLHKLISDLRDLSEEEPIITIDQEGGRVSRLRLIGAEPPNAMQLRATGRPDLIRTHGELTAKLLRLFGFNLDLCPVLDISLDDDADNSLRGRCYGRTVKETIENAGVFNAALREGGILSCGKHFPGYTNAGLDPHHELPALSRTREEMESLELQVFRSLCGDLDSMMTGHIWISGLDEEQRPASLSRAVLHDLLREDMRFEGLVMTDDLDMGAILNHYGFADTMRMGLEAGNDLLMICHRVELIADAVEAISSVAPRTLDRALANVLKFRKKFAPPTSFSLEEFQSINDDIYQLRVETLGEEEAAKCSVEDGKRSPVELY